MKLIDLLVQELPKRSGWPEGANYAVQDADGTVKFAKTLMYLHYLAGEWRSNENGYDWIYGDRPFDGNFVTRWTADDNHQAVISMARYECEISNNELQEQPTNEWNGEGLPPVGCECELKYKCHNDDAYWGRVVILWQRGDDTLVEYVGDHFKNTTQLIHKTSMHVDFRPLRTEADKKHDEVINEIASMIGRGTFYEDAERIYEAIAAGKIPGVKLEE